MRITPIFGQIRIRSLVAEHRFCGMRGLFCPDQVDARKLWKSKCRSFLRRVLSFEGLGFAGDVASGTNGFEGARPSSPVGQGCACRSIFPSDQGRAGRGGEGPLFVVARCQLRCLEAPRFLGVGPANIAVSDDRVSASGRFRERSA
jgi:hypothetical protein